MREESETFVIWVWENKSAFWISLCISRIEPKPENSEQIEACECWREVLNYPREVFVLSTLDTVLPSERITVLPKLSNVFYRVLVLQLHSFYLLMNTLNSNSSGLVACKRKFVSKDCSKALCLLCCIIFVCMEMCNHRLFGKDVAFFLFVHFECISSF